MKKFLITLLAVILIIVCGALKNVWAGFVYFALVFSCLISLYWAVILIINYINRFHKQIEKEFNLYIAQKINKSNLTLEDVEKNRKAYLKKFSRSKWKEKSIEIAKTAFCLGLFIGCLILCFTLKV